MSKIWDEMTDHEKIEHLHKEVRGLINFANSISDKSHKRAILLDDKLKELAGQIDTFRKDRAA